MKQKEKVMEKEVQYKLRAIIESPEETENVINAGTVEDSNYGKIGHIEGDCYYIYFEDKWYYCQHLSIINGFTGKEYSPYKYSSEFKIEECYYSDVAEYVGIGQENKMSAEIIKFVESTRTV